MPGTCPHIGAITDVRQPRRRECEECAAIGAERVHLRWFYCYVDEGFGRY